MLLVEADIGGAGGGGTGSVGRAAIATPAACCDSWLFIDTGTTVVADVGNAEEDDNLETEDIGTIKELVDDVDVFSPAADVNEVVE